MIMNVVITVWKVCGDGNESVYISVVWMGCGGGGSAGGDRDVVVFGPGGMIMASAYRSRNR